MITILTLNCNLSIGKESPMIKIEYPSLDHAYFLTSKKLARIERGLFTYSLLDLVEFKIVTIADRIRNGTL
jgi:hypothetical protein